MEWVNGGYYNANGYVKTIDGAGEIPDTPDPNPGETMSWRVYYNDTNWGSATVYTYVWDAGDNNKEYLGSWPGKAMTKNSDGLWEMTFTTTKMLTSPMIIFNNGQGGGGANQTADLALINNGVYGYEGFRYTGVSSIANVDMKIYTSNGVLYIISPIATDLHIVRADGISIAKTIHEGLNTIDDLSRGFYIIGRKKVVL